MLLNKRFIPVHTGNMDEILGEDMLSSVYPCAYREHSSVIYGFKKFVGLSLCIQGTLGCGYSCYSCIRFIPVHTGNIWRFNLFCHHLAVYPCAYREHLSKRYSITKVAGLSLCIQGTSNIYVYDNLVIRFIPVHTGNIVDADSKVMDNAVYPCAYREHSFTKSRSHKAIGLSLCIQGTFALVY